MTVGFIGTGIMGKSMIRNLMKKGYSLVIYNRTREKAEELISEGAQWADNPRLVAEQSDVILSIVGYPSDVEEIYFGKNGILAGARRGSYIADMTTSSPSLAKKIYDKAKEAGIHAMDAPVTGGDGGARNGTLCILCGGDKEDFDYLLPVFEAMGKQISYMGPAGCGQHTKAVNQIAIAGALSGVAEAFSYAKNCGLDPDEVLAAIGGGAAGSYQMNTVYAKALKGNFEPGFYAKHLLKDITIAKDEAEEMGLDLPVLSCVKQIYEEICEDGLGSFGTQVIAKKYK